jgi:hypothetical protein
VLLLAARFTRLTAHRKWQRSQPSFRDLSGALETQPVRTPAHDEAALSHELDGVNAENLAP